MTRPQLKTILDANFNRSREALRVCEEVARFILRDARAVRELRAIRHGVTRVLRTYRLEDLLRARNTARDPGKSPHRWEKRRANWRDLYGANLERSKEALRVLEEVTKLDEPQKSKSLKALRFKLYDHEKRTTPKL